MSSNSWCPVGYVPEYSSLSMAQWAQVILELPRPFSASGPGSTGQGATKMWSSMFTSVTLALQKKGQPSAHMPPCSSTRWWAPMERVAVDILGPFPATERGNRYILVAMDYFTKWPEAYAVPDQSAATTAEHLVNEMFCRFVCVPEELHSDQGRAEL
ncbi:hypothetical protein L3Q82_007765 [Scortum barcoo]|uniref:Uncharacterized protein n=1 Tax=Scortum barcoo TaxID=214431 RepID=A0ACB8WP05_9TELE|nr:hypothetical protein L3Q82_007765 [Scortum barcoo]